MKFKLFAKSAALVMGLLGLGKIPLNAEESATDFTDQQKKDLEAKLGAEKSAKLIEAFDKELKAMNDGNADLSVIDAELSAFLAQNPDVVPEAAEEDPDEDEDPDDDEDSDDGDKKKPKATTATIEGLSRKVGALTKGFSEQKKTIAALMAKPEDEVKTQTTTAVRTNILKHSATHLFGMQQEYMAFEGRPWNERMRDSSAQTTDFNKDGIIPLLAKDAEHFVRQNPEVLTSLIGELVGLPAGWDYLSGVLDQVAEGGIIPGEIVQGNAKGWNPKNQFKIVSEIGQVFEKKIDITFSGYELKKIENTWIRAYNKEGSHPWKMHFIYTLLRELVKQQFVDDRNAQINGIYVKFPDDMPGAAVNSQNGLLYLFHKYRDIEKKYRAYHLGVITEENIVDKMDELVKSMPELERKAEGLEIGMSDVLQGWYRKRAGDAYQLMMNTDEGRTVYAKDHLLNFPNIKIVSPIDMVNTQFVYITKSKNIQVMEYLPGEKNQFTFTMEKRDVNIFTDYRLGIRLKFVGVKLGAGETKNFEKQMVWSNEAPIFPAEVSVPNFDDTTGILKVVYPVLKVDKKFNTNITEIDGVVPGQVIKIIGNVALSAARLLTKNASIAINSNYALNTDGHILLYKNADGTFKELKRTTVADSTPADKITFDSEVLDVANGSVFYFDGAAAETLDNIINGVEGKTVKIYGKNATETLTVEASNPLFSVAANVVLKAAADFIELINVGGVYFEVNKQTTP